MEADTPQGKKQVKHFIVQPDVFNEIMGVINELPTRIGKPLVDKLEATTKAEFLTGKELAAHLKLNPGASTDPGGVVPNRTQKRAAAKKKKKAKKKATRRR
jgi:hypothetical protein